MANIIGMKAALLAYKDWKTSKNSGNDEKSLPGFSSYSNDQMFWLSHAMVRCTKYTSGTIKYMLNSKYRKYTIPEEFKVIGSMSNIPEFFKAYACPNDSLMSLKCRIF